jgi:uncharacterized protein (TIRG00374 family)
MRAKRGFLILRLLVGAAILFYLFRSMPRSALLDVWHDAREQPGWLAAGLAFTFMGLAMGVARWKQILETHRLHAGFFRVFQVFFIGQFFNAFMPGACGGDVARAYYVARGEHGKRVEAASTVFVDRAVGLFVTVVFCCVFIVVRLPFFLVSPRAKAPGLFMLAFLVATVLGLLALFRRNVFEHIPVFRRVERNTALGPLIRRAYEAFYLYRQHPRVMLQAVVFSVLNLVCLTLACVCFGRAIHLPLAQPLLDHFTFFPIITTLAAVPLTPGALGLREGLFAGLYGVVGVGIPHAIALSLMVYISGLLWGLLGAVFFVTHATAEHRGLREELARLREERERAEAADAP